MSLPSGRPPRYPGNPWTDPDPPAPGTTLNARSDPGTTRDRGRQPGGAVPGPGVVCRSVRRLVLADGHEQPQQGVDEDAAAAADGEGEKGHPPDDGVHAGVLGETAGDTGDLLLGPAAGQPGQGRGGGTGSRGGGHGVHRAPTAVPGTSGIPRNRPWSARLPTLRVITGVPPTAAVTPSSP